MLNKLLSSEFNLQNLENGASHKKAITFLAKIVIKSDNFL